MAQAQLLAPRAFHITVSPVVVVHHCKAYQALEAAGQYYRHDWQTCPDCQREVTAWEFWGENGHLQGSYPTPGTASRAVWRHRRQGDIVEAGKGIIYYVGRGL